MIELDIKPVADIDGKLRLGVWVNSTAGVGTLTFIDPKGRWFGGLGHAICDLDTGSILSVRQGEIYFSEIIQINKGESGIPGEIKGFFSSASGTMGLIMKNTEYGIYGKLYNNVELEHFSRPLPVARNDEVMLGLQAYSARSTTKASENLPVRSSKSASSRWQQKGLVIRVTDKELLEKTGGIVQGMSGSPIVKTASSWVL